MKQKLMNFGQADLPLFSGTPITVRVRAPIAAPAARQATFATCRVCLDTGRVQVRRAKIVACSCPAGRAARHTNEPLGATPAHSARKVSP